MSTFTWIRDDNCVGANTDEKRRPDMITIQCNLKDEALYTIQRKTLSRNRGSQTHRDWIVLELKNKIMSKIFNVDNNHNLEYPSWPFKKG